jgi:ABC-type dipeptide/oligopeptide/nickel transport system permease subunit
MQIMKEDRSGHDLWQKMTMGIPLRLTIGLSTKRNAMN